MKHILPLVFLAGALATSSPAHARHADCVSEDFASGFVLYSDISPDIRYSVHCLVPQHDGDLSIVVIGADTPIEVEASQGGTPIADTVEWKSGKRYPVSREIRFPVRAGQRIGVRVDPLVPGKQRHGGYQLLATTSDSNDPARFATLALMDGDGRTMKYNNVRALEGVITLAPNQAMKVYIPNVGKYPNLRLGVDGVDPELLLVGTIDVSTGQAKTARLRDGKFDIPMLDPDGIVLWMASKSLQPVSFRIKD